MLRSLTYSLELDYYQTKNEVRVLDMADLDGSQNVRIIMRFTYGIQYGIPGDIAILHNIIINIIYPC